MTTDGQLIKTLQSAAQRSRDAGLMRGGRGKAVSIIHVVELGGIRVQGTNAKHEIFSWLCSWADIRDAKIDVIAEGEGIVEDRLKSTRRSATH